MIKKCPISFNGYTRISTIVISALNDLQEYLSMDCTFVAIISNAILHHHQNINAIITSGQANVYLGSGELLSFGNGILNGESQEKFHMWNRIDDWLIDFSAPIYNEAYQAVGGTKNIRRKMLAIQIDEAGRFLSTNSLTEFVEDSNPRHELINSYKFNDQFNRGLNECLRWYKPWPYQIFSSHECKEPFGKSKNIPILDLNILEAWH